MLPLQEYSPRRYHVDATGRRVLVGLTAEETFEFETLDSLLPSGEGADRAGAGKATGSQNQAERWLKLYAKHEDAWRAWMAAYHS